MSIPNIPEEKMRKALMELEQAAHNHDQWAEMLYGTLICRLPPDERDISEDAHRICRFGQWYHRSGIDTLAGHPGLEEIGREHERMHQYARSLLRSAADGVPISIDDYERFISALKRMRLEIDTVRREVEDALYNLDPLTGAPSRVGMLTKLREQREFVKRSVHSCVIAMMDLDHFKSVNDDYGHLVGDKVLVAFARYISAHLRPYDKIFRYGGEEFLLCLPDTDLHTGSEIVDRLREELGSLTHDVEGSGPIRVTVSFGLALLDPDVSVEETIDRADKALYAAKAHGRNATAVWDASMSGPETHFKESA
jgi:diguanylate cyclase (GGDEF)-like protein